VNNAFCTADSMEVKVNISESYLAVPNVFTPNGDGMNDEFRVAYRSLKEFHIWVYNRWGKLVYESTDPAKGWDGTINGRPAAEGAYFYVVRAKGTDADKYADYIGLKATYNKKKLEADKSVIGIYQMSGDINLIRGSRK
jgi:gliding motility-associated-like protein